MINSLYRNENEELASVDLCALVYYPGVPGEHPLHGFFGLRRVIFFSQFCQHAEDNFQRTIKFSGEDMSDIVPYLKNEKIDFFINLQGNTKLRNIDSLGIRSICIVGDTHFLGNNSLRQIIQYLRQERYELIWLLSKYEHAHFFEHLRVPVALSPSAGVPKQESDLSINSIRFVEVAYIGHRASFANFRSTRMLNDISNILKKNNISLKVLPHSKYYKYLEALSSTKMVVICTANSQLTPQIYIDLQMGPLCFIDRLSHYSGIQYFFQEGVDYIAWDNFQDLCNKIIYYSQNEIERKAIANSGKEKALKLFPRNNEALGLLYWNKNKQFVPDFFLPTIERKVKESDQFIDFDLRLAFYEQIQEWHRIYETVYICFFSNGLKGLSSDIDDLIRIKKDSIVFNRGTFFQPLPIVLVLMFEDISKSSNNINMMISEANFKRITIVIIDLAGKNCSNLLRIGTILWKRIEKKKVSIFKRKLQRVINLIFPKIFFHHKYAFPNVNGHYSLSYWNYYHK